MPKRILIVRLGAMGDILHALPAAASLKGGGGVEITWVVKPQFRELLDGGGLADRIVEFRRCGWSELRASWRELRDTSYEAAVDFQGLVQSALTARASRAQRVYGFAFQDLREKAAGLFYDVRVRAETRHVVEKNLEVALAAGARERVIAFPLPQGRQEGVLPRGRYVLAAPFAGWISKQWPGERYAELGRMLQQRLGVTLVVNIAPAQAAALERMEAMAVHVSSISGLIHATRNAAAVVGVDSGPLHLAAALGVSGVALYGPTDPGRNGPYSPAIRVLRAPGFATSYKREDEIHGSMRAISAEAVFAALSEVL